MLCKQSLNLKIKRTYWRKIELIYQLLLTFPQSKDLFNKKSL